MRSYSVNVSSANSSGSRRAAQLHPGSGRALGATLSGKDGRWIKLEGMCVL